MSDYLKANRISWDYLARHGNDRPYTSEDFANAKSLLDPEHWIPWDSLSSILCLASGAGRRGSLFASLGYDVTVVDWSREQLRRDQQTARRYGLAVECIEADIGNLQRLQGRKFDLVSQASSSCYVPDVGASYREAFRLLAPGGYYHVEHWNPIHLQLPQYGAWDGVGYRVVRPQTSHRPVRWREWDEKGQEKPTCLHYIHSLQELIGGLCDTGFVVECFGERQLQNLAGEPGTPEHLAAFVPPFITILARRLAEGGAIDGAH
jgi:SAM-dependent methyltransferase